MTAAIVFPGLLFLFLIMPAQGQSKVCKSDDDWDGAAIHIEQCHRDAVYDGSEANCTAAGCNYDTYHGGCNCPTEEDCQAAGGTYRWHDGATEGVCEDAWDEAMCKAAGCTSIRHGHCGCDHAPLGCERTGGTWTTETCDVWLGNEGAELATKLEEIHSSGDKNCDDYSIHEGPFADHIREPASKCCKSFPASVCRKDLRQMTPCKDPADFDASRPYDGWCEIDEGEWREDGCTGAGCSYGEHPECRCTSSSSCGAAGGAWKDDSWCEYPETPSKEMCEAAQCQYYVHKWCGCHNAASCEAMGSGIWKTETCGAKIKSWPESLHTLLATMDTTSGATCDGVTIWDHEEPFANYVRGAAEKCCSSYPADICHKDWRKMTPCKDSADFIPDGRMEQSCTKSHPDPPEANCTASGCHAMHGTYCSCVSEQSCMMAAGEWYADSGKCRVPDSSSIDDASCTSFGCDVTPNYWCECWEEGPCTAAGFHWSIKTCQMEVDEWGMDDVHVNLMKFADQGHCVEGEISGEPAAGWIQHAAQICCRSFPDSVCGEMITPCQDELAYDEAAIDEEWCDWSAGDTTRERCTAGGCTGQTGSFCSCESEDACARASGTWMEKTYCQLDGEKTEGECTGSGCNYHEWEACECHEEGTCIAAGGHWARHTCGEAAVHWGVELFSKLNLAKIRKSCDGIDYHGRPLAQFVSPLAAKCCPSNPTHFCLFEMGSPVESGTTRASNTSSPVESMKKAKKCIRISRALAEELNAVTCDGDGEVAAST
mmetsp:Transcript_111847/g.249628  ORF Transcript_111847/g.249628 Transcript_111847/m.249628 type:complete len:768 (-) Transcript_111847:74-2377(-)